MAFLPLLVGCEGHHAHPHPPRRSILPHRAFWPSRLMDQDFGLPLTGDDFLTFAASPLHTEDYYRPWRHVPPVMREIGSSITTAKDKFQINLDVQHFAPDEISVKTVDKYVVVEGKHDEKKDDHGYISRQFVRRYALPEGVAHETVESHLSSDGVLTIIAPRKIPDAIKGERKVNISQTGPVRKVMKEDIHPEPGFYMHGHVPPPGHVHLVHGMPRAQPAFAVPPAPGAQPAFAVPPVPGAQSAFAVPPAPGAQPAPEAQPAADAQAAPEAPAEGAPPPATTEGDK